MFDLSPIGASALAVLALMAMVMAGAWITQRAVNNAGWIDVFWTFGTGAACVLAALWPAPAENETRQFIVAALAAIWALRLGLYIAARVATAAEDTRYARLREQWGADFQRKLIWLAAPQAPATALLSLSVFVAAHGGGADLSWRDSAGVLILIIGIAGEALADEQMRQFKNSAPRGAIMDKGLWAWSRHPNYFFEWLVWLAYPMLAFDPARPLSWAALIAPAIMYVILRHGTGVPILERIMLERRGQAFSEYQARVSAFFPWPPRRRSA